MTSQSNVKPFVPSQSLSTLSQLNFGALPELEHTTVYPAQTELIHQGERPVTVGLLRSGIVKLGFLDEDDAERNLGLRSKGWWMNGNLALLGLSSLVTVTTVTECEVSLVPAVEFSRLLASREEVASHFHASQCRELVIAQQHSIAIGRTAEERLRYLIGESSRAIWDTEGPAFKARQSEVAERLGITTEELSRLRNKRAFRRYMEL